MSSDTNLTKEIERKFLIKEFPEEIVLNKYEFKKIAQGYLLTNDDGVVRLRIKGDKYFLTYKRSIDGNNLEKIELETELTKEQFDILWPATQGRRVEKIRYLIPFGKYTVELDVFEGGNKGKMLLEVEFPNTQEAKDFSPEKWFGKEVTHSEKYSNVYIADNGFPED